MQLQDPTFRLNLTALGIDPFPVAGGTIEVGTRLLQKFPKSANFAIASKISFGADAEQIAFSLEDFGFTSSVAPVAQVETATAAGTVTADGSALVTVTSALFTAPIAVPVPLVNTDTATIAATKIRAALSANEKINALFIITGATPAIILTARTASYNDGTLNIAIATGTATGLTAAATSADTTAGVHGVQIQGYTGNGEDAYGQPLPTLPYIHGLLINVLSGLETSSLEDIGAVTATQTTLRPGSSYIVTNIPTIDLAADTITLARAGVGNTPLVMELVLIGGPTPTV